MISSDELLNYTYENIDQLSAKLGFTEKPRRLGMGSFGSAWRVGNQVIKVTQDASEANNAAVVKSHPHPNVYRVTRVLRLKTWSFSWDTPIFAIVYDYLEAPSQPIERAASILTSGVCLGGSVYEQFFDTWPGSQEVIEVINNIEDSILVSDRALKTSLKGKFSRSVAEYLSLDISRYLMYASPRRSVGTNVTSERKALWSAIDGIVEGTRHLKNILGVLPEDISVQNVLEKNGQPVLIDLGVTPSNTRGTIEIDERLQKGKVYTPQDIEDLLKSRDREYGVALRDDTLLWHRRGKSGEIDLTDVQKELEDTFFVHNHPAERGNYTDCLLSPGDIITAMMYNMRGMKAVARDGSTMTMTRLGRKYLAPPNKPENSSRWVRIEDMIIGAYETADTYAKDDFAFFNDILELLNILGRKYGFKIDWVRGR